MDTVRNVVYAVVGLIGLFIVIVAVVCVSVHIYHCCRRRRKRSDAVGDTGSRPSASSTAVDCQYITLQTNDGAAAAAAVVTAPHNEPGSRESAELQQATNQSDIKPPSYDEVMGFQWIYHVTNLRCIRECVLVMLFLCASCLRRSCTAVASLPWNYFVGVNLCHILCCLLCKYSVLTSWRNRKWATTPEWNLW